MKKIFTKSICLIAAMFLFIGFTLPVTAQTYTLNTVGTNVEASAVAKDAAGNVYVIESLTTGTSTTNGKLLKYAVGTTSSPTTIYSGSLLPDRYAGINDNYPFGLVISSTNDIYFTTAADYDNGQYGQIMKIAYNGGAYGTPTAIRTGTANDGLYASLAIDASDNLYTIRYNVNGNSGTTTNGVPGAYEVAKYNTSGTLLGSFCSTLGVTGFASANTYSARHGLAVNPINNDVYVADNFDVSGNTDGGRVYRVQQSSGNAVSTFTTGTYATSLAFDASGNLYETIANTRPNYKLVKYAQSSGVPSTTATDLYTSLGSNAGWFPFGIINLNGNFFVTDGGSTSNTNHGNLLQLVAPPTTAATAVNFTSTATTTTTVNWTNGDGASRVVFMANVSTGGPTPVNSTAYTASTTFGSGTQSTAGWYCIYNGTGTSVAVTGLTAGQTYRVKVFEYNGTTGNQNYLQSDGTNNPNNVTTVTPTTITSINRVTATPSNLTSVNFTAVFGSAVTGVTASNFSLTASGVAGASVGTPTTSDNITWTVPVNTGTGDGSIQLNLANATGLSRPISTSLPYAGQSYDIEKTAPTINIGSPSLSTIVTGSGSVTYTVTYADANFNSSTLSTGDITLNTTGGANGVIGVSGAGLTRTVTISSITGSGSLGISIAAGTATDLAGNLAPAAGPSTTFSVTLNPETITFAALPTTTYGDADFAPGATSDNGGVTITYSSDNTSVATIVSGKIHIAGAGSANITASQAGDATHSAAADQIQPLTVDAAPLTITADNQSKAYGDALPTLTATITGFVNGDTGGSLTTQPTLTTTATAASHVAGSPYSITVSGAVDPNYSISYVAGTLTVGTAPLTITADNKSMVFGDALPTLTASYTGFVNGDTGASLTTQPTLSTTATSASPVGPYSITASSAVDADYAISYVAGVLTINPSTDATLSALTTTANNLTPAFDSGTLSYTATALNTTTSVTVTPTASDANSSIEVQVNGGGYAPVSSGAVSGPLALNVGDNVIEVQVTAQDGTTNKTYSITVSRAPSTDALLSIIKYTPKVKTTVVTGSHYRDFTATVDNSVSSVTVSPITHAATSTVKVNGETVASGATSSVIALNVGTTTIDAVVTAEDGVTQKTYSIVITREGDALLSSIKYAPGVKTTVVTGSHYRDFTATVNNSVSAVTVSPITHAATSTVKVNGETVASGATSSAIALNVGTNTIDAVVTAEDGVTQQIYSIVISRLPSTDALLSIIKYMPGVKTTVVTGSHYRDFTATVNNSVSSVTVNPITHVTTSTVTVNGETVASGATSSAIALTVGTTTIDAVVTAEDGVTTNTYSIVITRQAPVGLASLYDDKLVAVAPVRNTDIVVHQNVSPNGDGRSDVLIIDGITTYPENTLQIMNRSGSLVYEAKGYDNTTKAFDGHATTNGKLQQAGTYFYSLAYKDGAETKRKTGYIILKY